MSAARQNTLCISIAESVMLHKEINNKKKEARHVGESRWICVFEDVYVWSDGLGGKVLRTQTQGRNTVKHKDRSAPTPAYLFIETYISLIKIGLSRLHFD